MRLRTVVPLTLVALVAACGGADDDVAGAAGSGGASGSSAGTAGKGGSGAAGAGQAGTAGKAGGGGAAAGAGGSSSGAGGSSAGAGGGAAGAGGSTAGAAGSSAGKSGAGGSSAGKSGAGGSSAGAGGSSAGAGGSSAGSQAAGSGGATAACPGKTPGPTGHVTGKSVTVKGASRTYSLDVPAPLDPAKTYPVVFVLHGDGGTGEGIRGAYGFASFAGNDAIFVYPDAPGPAKSWVVDVSPPDNPDIDAFDAVLAAVKDGYCVDASRVFAVGMSRGGFFANRLGCDRGDVLRGISPQAGSIYTADPNGYTNEGFVKCTTDGPAVFGVHGLSDNVVPAKDGEYARDMWAFESQCKPTTQPVSPSPCVAYDGCEAAHPVVWCEVPGLAHAVWSEAPKATWAFFSGL